MKCLNNEEILNYLFKINCSTLSYLFYNYINTNILIKLV